MLGGELPFFSGEEREASSESRPKLARKRGVVRIRIYRIVGIFRISLLPARAFAAIGHPAKRNSDKRLPIENARRENPENPIILQILILTNPPPNQPAYPSAANLICSRIMQLSIAADFSKRRFDIATYMEYSMGIARLIAQ